MGTPASINARQLPHVDAMDVDPFEESISILLLLHKESPQLREALDNRSFRQGAVSYLSSSRLLMVFVSPTE